MQRNGHLLTILKSQRKLRFLHRQLCMWWRELWIWLEETSNPVSINNSDPTQSLPRLYDEIHQDNLLGTCKGKESECLALRQTTFPHRSLLSTLMALVSNRYPGPLAKEKGHWKGTDKECLSFPLQHPARRKSYVVMVDSSQRLVGWFGGSGTNTPANPCLQSLLFGVLG